MAATSSEQPEDLKNEDNSGSDVIVIEAQDKTEVTETDAVDGKQPLRKKSRRFGLDRLNPKRRSKSREDLTFETAIDNMVRTILKRSRSQEEAPILPEQSQARTSEVVRSQEHPQAQRRPSRPIDVNASTLANVFRLNRPDLLEGEVGHRRRTVRRSIDDPADGGNAGAGASGGRQSRPHRESTESTVSGAARSDIPRARGKPRGRQKSDTEIKSGGDASPAPSKKTSAPADIPLSTLSFGDKDDLEQQKDGDGLGHEENQHEQSPEGEVHHYEEVEEEVFDQSSDEDAASPYVSHKASTASSPRKKLSLISEGDDQGTQQFGDAIRAGSTNVVQDFLLNNSLEILRLPVIIFDVTLRRLPNRRVGNPSSNHQTVPTTLGRMFGQKLATHHRNPSVQSVGSGAKAERMYITPFHCAILSRRPSMVKLMMDFILEDTSCGDPKAVLKDVLCAKTRVVFSRGKSEQYFKDDRVLNGINAFHLAAKFDAHSLLIMAKALKEAGMIEELREPLLEAKDAEMGKTPLHLAVKNLYPLAAKILVACGAFIDAQDNRGYTPLHVAAKEGNEEVCLVLLENYADPNMHGNAPQFYKTPLHRARTKGVVQLLIQNGADKFAKCIDWNYNWDPNSTTVPVGNYPMKSAYEVMLERHPQAVLELLNSGIQTNSQDIDSVDLQVVYNFELFFQEGCKKPRQDNNDDNDDNTAGSTLVKKQASVLDIYKMEDVDEMSALVKIVEANQRDLLKHPLVEAFLHLKWQKVRKFFIANMVFYILYLTVFTSLACVQTAMMRCPLKNITNVAPAPNLTSPLNVTSLKLHPINGMLSCSIPDGEERNIGKWDVDSFYEVLSVYLEKGLKREKILAGFFIFLYICTGLGLGFFFCRELMQAIFTPKDYFKHFENLMEAVTILLTLLYLSITFYEMTAAIHLATWGLLFAWIEMTLLIGRIPSIGIFIYMSVTVMNTLFVFLLIFASPLFSFAIIFHLLLPSKNVFDNPWISSIKVLTMMIGEFDLSSYFTVEQARLDEGQFSTQLLFIFFIIFVSIVISNLLVGLTVSKTEELFKEAGVIRLEKTVLQVNQVEKVFLNPKASVISWFPNWCCGLKELFKHLIRSSRMFASFEVLLPSNKGKNFNDSGSTKQDSSEDSRRASPWKLSVRPFGREQNRNKPPTGRIFDIRASLDTSASSFEKDYKVNVYDDVILDMGPRLSCKLPPWVVDKTLKLLVDRKTQDDRLRMAVIKDDFDFDVNESVTFQDLVTHNTSASCDRGSASKKSLYRKVSLDEVDHLMASVSEDTTDSGGRWSVLAHNVKKRKASRPTSFQQIVEAEIEDAASSSATSTPRQTPSRSPLLQASASSSNYANVNNVSEVLLAKFESLQTEIQELKAMLQQNNSKS